MTTVTPAKIKACIAFIKEQFLDDGATEGSVGEIFAASLKMELLLRGVLIQDDKKLWSQIQSSVGKSLLTDLPKPLLAGMNVVAGRLVEKLNQELQKEAAETNRSTLLPKDQADGAIQRAKDIEDERWLVLLSPEHKTDNDMLQIALGYFSSAARIQSDTPPMWKKVWDTWTLLGDVEDSSDDTTNVPPFEAQVAIDNLIRIANTKGNTKRTFELQLRLVQSYLNTNRIKLTAITSKTRKKEAPKLILECFGGSASVGSSSDLAKMTDRAVSMLKECQSYFEKQIRDAELWIPECLLYQTLWVQSLVMQQDAKIQTDAHEMYVLSQSRAPGKTTLGDCIKKCRESFLVTNVVNSTDPFQNVLFLSASITLRDTMLAFWRTNDELQNGLSDAVFEKNLCCHWVEESAIRLRECANIISHKTTAYFRPWKTVLEYILPVIKEMENQIASNSPEQWLQQELDKSSQNSARMTLISSAISMLPDVYWMMLGDDNFSPQPLDSHMSFVTELLTTLVHKQEAINHTKQQESKESSAIGGEEISEEALRVQTWKHAKAVASCFICQDDAELTYRITRDAISSSKQKDATDTLGLLRCLIAWKGWYQRPWPYCASLSDTRRLLNCARSSQGRPLTQLEMLLLDIASADAEMLNGGFVDIASKKYSEVLSELKKMNGSTNNSVLALLEAHCYNGLARTSQILGLDKETKSSGGSFTHLALTKLNAFDFTIPESQLFVWHSERTFLASKAHQLSTARQLTADSLVMQGCFEEARSFLEAAVADLPSDAEAALAFGAFLLRMNLYNERDRDESRERAAQIQLLKAARLDPTNSSSFALLGLWFEHKGDSQRALGCFRKSLGLDPCDSVAGRGMLRLQGRENMQEFMENAIKRTSASNGWAWCAVGLNKAFVEGNDDFAVVAILKGLRCRDVAQPDSEKYGSFFFPPSKKLLQNEKSTALSNVAFCYRRLGRFTASIRAFHASIASAGDHVPSPILVACAQVELELGLFDDAVQKLSHVVDKGEDPVALHGHVTTLGAMAQRDLMDGKAGAALKRTELAIESCRNSSINSSIKFRCQQKLLGDLYSFGARFPPNVFAGDVSNSLDLETCLQNQLKFIAMGEECYRQCIDIQTKVTFAREEAVGLKSCIMCDMAVNFLFQAQVLSVLLQNNHDHNHQTKLSIELDEMYNKAADTFREILEQNPIHAPSWSGYGIAVLRKDPLLAQHAFCRCIELDKFYPDAYSNLGFLYTSRQSLDSSRDTMEALTQVADTPMMWMNCAYILEQEAAMRIGHCHKDLEGIMIQVSDAYRASLQLAKHPAAQLGLSLTSRVKKAKGLGGDGVIQTSWRKHAFLLMKEYAGASSVTGRPASVFEGPMNIEKAFEAPIDAQWKDIISKEGKFMMKETPQGKIAGVDISSFDKILNTCDAAADKEPNSKPANLTLQSIQEKILTDHEQADLWMLLAKEAVSIHEIELASDAASRASFMLSHQFHDFGMSSSVDASIFSEAVSLYSWLKELTQNADRVSESTTYDMQRALLMDPENGIARQGL